jgi:hypothetical protein
MGAFSMFGFGHVTVETKDLESRWKTFTNEPSVESPTALNVTKDLFSMFVPMAVYVVDCEEISF